MFDVKGGGWWPGENESLCGDRRCIPFGDRLISELMLMAQCAGIFRRQSSPSARRPPHKHCKPSWLETVHGTHIAAMVLSTG